MKRLFYFFLFVCVAVIANAQAKYVFYFIGDGMGVNQVNGTEMYRAEIQKGRIGVEPLLFTQFPVGTMATTFSATNSVTDSSAAGTALSTGEKTYNGSIGMDDQKNPLQTVAEKAKKAGKRVGVTTSVSVDHATPAAFYAHQPDRNMYYEIATDLPKAGFDFYAGAGFLKPTTTYDKKEAPSIFPMFEEAGYTIAKGIDDFKVKSTQADKMILIQKDGANPSCLPYSIDRKDGDMTLAEITESAVSFLTKGKNKGFFLMVEGGKIDWACHSNDPATVFEEVIDMDNAIKVAYEFYKKQGWHYQQYIACLDPLEEAHGENEYALEPKQYGRFLIELFELWYADWKNGTQPYIRQFENYVGLAAGYMAESCEQRGVCGIQNVVEADGSVYPCDFYMLDEYRLGNFNANQMEEINAKRKEIGFIERSLQLKESCKSCPYFFICRGGCQRNRDYDQVSGMYENYFCKSYEMFFDACLPKMKEMAETLKRR